jgi:hypothetical protein
MHNSSSFYGLIGIARGDITPPPGISMRNWGAATSECAAGVHRPLLATVLTLQRTAEDQPLVLVALDLGWWRDRDDEALVRQTIRQALNLAEERLIIALSHTHAGPTISLLDTDRPGGELIEPYLRMVAATCIELVDTARRAAMPAVLSWGQGRCTLACNRDLPDPARPRFLVGYNPDLPADDTLLVGRITAADGHILATIVNYACHPTTLAWQNDLISPDYVGAMRELVEAQVGGICLFLQGASGELAPAEQYTGDTAVADRHGRTLGYACMAVLEAMPAPGVALQCTAIVESGAPLAVWSQVAQEPAGSLAARACRVPLPLKADLTSLAELEATLAVERDPVLIERLRRKWGVRRIVGDGTAWAMPLVAWQIGGAWLVAQPNEAYSLLQRELRRRFPNHALAVLNLANGSCGYLAPAERYRDDLYPVWQSPFAAGGLELLIETVTSLVLSFEVARIDDRPLTTDDR